MTKTKDKKAKFLIAFENAFGNISMACSAIGITRQTFYLWKNKDDEFAEKVKAIEEKNIDLAETALLRNVREGKETSIIFFLKTKGKERGYVERTEADVSISPFEKLMQELDEKE